MKTITIDEHEYYVRERVGKKLIVRNYDPVISPEEKRRRNEYATRRCVDILNLHG